MNEPAAPVFLTFNHTEKADNLNGAQCEAKLFPTGSRIDVIDGIECTCIAAEQIMVIMRAGDIARAFPDHAIRGDEPAAVLDAIPGLILRLEEIRRIAGERMGLGDVANSVVPKPVIVSPPPTNENGVCTGSGLTSHAVTDSIGLRG